MALNRQQIVQAAYATLRDHGLAGLSMRRLAQDLGVQAGALYYHVASKQELLAAVAELILPDTVVETSRADPARAASDIRDALLLVRDSADVISFVYVFRPEAAAAFRALDESFAAHLAADDAHRAAHTLTCYILGFVAEQQNYAELVRAGIRPAGRPADVDARERFQHGVDVIVRGAGMPPGVAAP